MRESRVVTINNPFTVEIWEVGGALHNYSSNVFPNLIETTPLLSYGFYLISDRKIEQIGYGYTIEEYSNGDSHLVKYTFTFTPSILSGINVNQHRQTIKKIVTHTLGIS